MNVVHARIPDVLILEPEVFSDDRGFFFESFNARTFAEKTGVSAVFVQDNHSRSGKGVLRGLHYQIRRPQGKYVRVIAGEVFDVAVDIRKSSPTFGQWVATTLSADNKRMLWIPPGLAHGFLAISEYAEMVYKTTDYWMPTDEHCILWNDPNLNICWPLQGDVRLSKKDQKGLPFLAAEVFP